MGVDTASESAKDPGLELDEDGHLLNADAWSEDCAQVLAANDGLKLTDDHWWLIRFVRQHYQRYGMPPLMLIVIRQLREQPGHADASSRTLYRLLPDGPIRLACRYAGLPKPESCI
ncbi:MAG: TusE/DsrC/DsvC family sulfur relay protein [Pseudomonadota bacterium]